jgi:hypothetical protein
MQNPEKALLIVVESHLPQSAKNCPLWYCGRIVVETKLPQSHPYKHWVFLHCGKTVVERGEVMLIVVVNTPPFKGGISTTIQLRCFYLTMGER